MTSLGSSKFWVVWRPGPESLPTFLHNTAAGAARRAERLAITHPESKFYVLEATKVYKLQKEGTIEVDIVD